MVLNVFSVTCIQYNSRTYSVSFPVFIDSTKPSVLKHDISHAKNLYIYFNIVYTIHNSTPHTCAICHRAEPEWASGHDFIALSAKWRDILNPGIFGLALFAFKQNSFLEV